MATNAIHTLKIGSTEYPIYGEGFKIDTLGSLSEGDFYPILLSDKWTRAQDTPTAAEDSKALVTNTVGNLSWHPFGKCLYVKNLRMGGIPDSGNPGGTLHLYGYIDAVEEDGNGMSSGESNQVLASGGADNSVHWRTIDTVGSQGTTGLVINGSSVTPAGDTWKPVAFKDGVPYYQEVTVDASTIPGLDDILNDLRNSIFSEGPGISIYEEQGQTAKKVGLKLATANERGGIRIGYTQTGNNYPVKLGGENNEQAYVTVPTPSIPSIKPFSIGSETDYLNIDVSSPSRKYSVEFKGGDNVTIDYEGVSTNTWSGATFTINATDEKVTDESNHYTPSVNEDSTLSAAGGDTIDITNNPTSIVTGIKRDSKGHVVGLETTQLKSTAAEISVDNLDMSAYLKKDEAENTYLNKTSGGQVIGNVGITGALGVAGELGVQGVIHATSGVNGTATNAINDSDGEPINTTYLKRSGGTVNGTINVIADGVTITSNSTIESAGFRASVGVEIGETDITDEGPNTFYIGDRDGTNHVIFGVDGNGVTTTEIHATNIEAANITTPVLNSSSDLNFVIPTSTSYKFITGDDLTLLEMKNAAAFFDVPIYSTNGFFDTSDERLKEFGGRIPIDLDKLSNLKKSYFTWKNDKDKGNQIGVSAQEIQSLYPELVSETEDGTLTVAYDKLSVVALAAVDKLHDENTELKKTISSLEERLAKIESLLESQLNEIV